MLHLEKVLIFKAFFIFCDKICDKKIYDKVFNIITRPFFHLFLLFFESSTIALLMVMVLVDMSEISKAHISNILSKMLQE